MPGAEMAKPPAPFSALFGRNERHLSKSKLINSIRRQPSPPTNQDCAEWDADTKDLPATPEGVVKGKVAVHFLSGQFLSFDRIFI